MEEDTISIGVCRFHIADGVGGRVGRKFRETILFDQLLRLLRRHFAFGTGCLILKSVAARFAQMAREIEEEAREMLVRSDTARQDGKPLAAERMRKNAQKREAEAKALHQVGWTKWRRPRAPKADGTRKVVYQSEARSNFFNMFGILLWGLRMRRHQSLDSSRRAAIGAGRKVTQKTGQSTKSMKAWKSLARAMVSVEMLIFNMGRSDFRRKHLAAYSSL